MYNEKQICPISGVDASITYLDLGMMPLVNNLNNSREDSLKCPRFPLKVQYHPTFGLSCLSGVVDPDVLFANYVYKSGISQPYIDHCKKLYESIVDTVEIKDGDLFVDVGGNDGTLLETFKSINPKINVLNVDPSVNIGQIAREKGIETVTAMWDGTVDVKECKVITSTNVFQHTDPIRNFVKGIVKSLAKDGIWVLEFPYWKQSLETKQFDQVYHEHIYYYLLTPLVELFRQEGLEIIDAEEQEIHGGSLRVISRITQNQPMPLKVSRILNKESVFTSQYYENWGLNVKTHTSLCGDYLKSLKANGAKIAAFGAAAKGCVFLNAAKLDHNTIGYIIDDTDTKQYKFMPGTGIQILPRDIIASNTPDYILILAHNFKDYIMSSLRKTYQGKFLVMIPEIQIYE